MFLISQFHLKTAGCIPSYTSMVKTEGLETLWGLSQVKAEEVGCFGLTVRRLSQVKAEEVVCFGTVLLVTHDQLATISTLKTVILVDLLWFCFEFPSFL